MKTINIDFLAKDDTIFHLLLAYMYDEIKDEILSEDRRLKIAKITELQQMDTTLRHVRFGGYDYRDGLENLVGLSQTIHIYETFIKFINNWFPEYKKIRIIGNSYNDNWITDLGKISVEFENYCEKV